MAEIFTSIFTKMKSRGGLKRVQRAKVAEVAWHHTPGKFLCECPMRRKVAQNSRCKLLVFRWDLVALTACRNHIVSTR